jgi:hypothetical protein
MHIASWCGTELKHGDNFTFFFLENIIFWDAYTWLEEDGKWSISCLFLVPLPFHISFTLVHIKNNERMSLESLCPPN